MKRSLLAMMALCGLVVANAAHAEDAKGPIDLPRVLLIGDSICGAYQKEVIRKLEGKAVVVKNKGNAERSGNGVKRIDEWLGDGKWDIIHFNWGLWDLYGWKYSLAPDKVHYSGAGNGHLAKQVIQVLEKALAGIDNQ